MKKNFQTVVLYFLPLSLLCGATSIAVLEIGVNIQYSMCKEGMFSYPYPQICGSGVPERVLNGSIKQFPGEMSTDRCYWGRKLNRWNELSTNHPNQHHLILRCLGTLSQSNGVAYQGWDEDYNPSWVDPHCICYCGGYRCYARELWEYYCMEGSRLESNSEFGCSKIRGIIPNGFKTTNRIIPDESISYNINRVYGYLWSSILGIIGLSILYVCCSNNNYFNDNIFKYIFFLCSFLGIIFQLIYLVILIPIQYNNNQLHISDRKNCPLSGVPEYSWRCNQYNTAIMVNIIFHSLTALGITCILIWMIYELLKNLLKVICSNIKLYINKIISGISYIFCIPCIKTLVYKIKVMIKTRQQENNNKNPHDVELSKIYGKNTS